MMADEATRRVFPTEPASHLRPRSRSVKSLVSTPESSFWRTFRSSTLHPSYLHLPITSLSFSPNSSLLAAASSTSVRVFSSLSLSEYDPDFDPTLFATLPLPDLAYSPSFRCDGALIAAGCENGAVRVFDLPNDKPPKTLRRLNAHSCASRVVGFPLLDHKLRLFSAGDDALFVQWDLPTETPLFSVPGAHRDYIRAGSPSPVSPDVFVTGSYDHTVKIWDARVDSGASSVLSINHGHPVESVLFLPSGGLVATAGGNTIKIWDVIAGGKPVYSVETHNKTVTALTLAKVRDDTRLLSVSIDGYLKSFDFSRFKITHSMRYPAPLLSVAFSPTGTIRVVGTNNGAMYMGIKKKKDEFEDQVGSDDFAWSVPLPEKPTSRKNIRYFKRGQSEKPSEGDFIIKRPEKVKLKEHDRLLRKFLHKDALVSVLKTQQTTSIMAVLEELVARRKLIKCISNLDNDELKLLLSFISKKATQPWCARFLMDLAKWVLEIRAEDIRSGGPEMAVHVRNLRSMVAHEIQVQRSLQEIQGMISPLLVIAGK
ncbi:U3 small nucleolar RNA-associated protein 15 [Rhynchospora pubera]|uniref:U3 small nucleolar RNA-associated protein 15 n=1 Tax=Rhynchospora pubera TaxID=906938 RepID=A0AAV8CVJ8_9POAL|nr:U3 small nucleolar RNA-associated protein 15 [Rhynchospora pubera]